jgi:predicted HTH transcriptional regulator
MSVEIVDSPVERPEVEYKAYLDLTEAKHRADLARHIAALANYGGGHIVFGIDNKGQPATTSSTLDTVPSKCGPL